MPWIIDSGATSHMCCIKEQISDYETLKDEEDVSLGDGFPLKAIGKGTVKLVVKVPGGTQKCSLTVLFVPDLSFNLFSIKKACLGGDKVAIFHDKTFELRRLSDDKVLVTGI